MPGPDSYKNFENDTSSITTTNTTGTVRMGSYTFRKRDLLLGGIALLALILVLALAIALAIEVAHNSDKTSPSSSIYGGSCESTDCLKVASRAREYMDPTQDPCEDFYTYACGGYAAANPRLPHLIDVDSVNQVDFKNIERVMYLLNGPVERNTEHSYERKMKHYLSACTNHYDKMDRRGWPFVQNVINKTPGWYLFGAFNASEFDFQETLKMVHIDFWTMAFFRVSLSPHMKDWTDTIVEMDFAGFGISPIYYSNNQNYIQVQTAYTQYIRYIASLISIDYNPAAPPDPNRVNMFTSDVFEVEQAMALFLLDPSGVLNPFTNETTRPLSQVNQELDGMIDMTDYLKTVFNEWPGKINPNTKVGLYRENFFVHLGAYLKQLMATDDGKRKLHNYLMWQLLNRYAGDLSWDYFHAKRRLVHLITGVVDPSDGAMSCLIEMDTGMPDAMSAIFIKHYVKQGNKLEGERVLNKIKQGILSHVDKFTWMDPINRNQAKKKISESLYKVGYADFMADENLMDQLYMTVSFSEDDHFMNVLNMNTLMRKRFNDEFGHQDHARDHWKHIIWSPAVDYLNFYHEMDVTYGMLQSPLFSAHGPAYINYGGVGSLMAETLLHAVDEIGSQYKLDRSNFGIWWTNTTITKYEVLKRCAVDMVKTFPLGPYDHPTGDQKFVMDAPAIYLRYAPILLSEATGIRVSYEAYMNDRPHESLPGVFTSQTPQKLFFLAYAQMHCRNTPDFLKASQAISLNLRGKERVNAAVSQVPEFTKAFQCRSNAKLYNNNKCVLF